MGVKSEEEKRTTRWRAVMAVTTVLLILIVVFFLFRMFTGNPLEGQWKSQDMDLEITVRDDGKLEVTWPERFAGEEISVEMLYDIDTGTKTLALHIDDSLTASAAEASDGAVTEEDLLSALDSLEGTYDYSLEQNQLTLTDREYGEQMVFDKR